MSSLRSHRATALHAHFGAHGPQRCRQVRRAGLGPLQTGRAHRARGAGRPGSAMHRGAVRQWRSTGGARSSAGARSCCDERSGGDERERGRGRRRGAGLTQRWAADESRAQGALHDPDRREAALGRAGRGSDGAV